MGEPGLPSPRVSAEALYVQGEVHRLRGDFDAAEEALRLAAIHGGEAQPGLALLRLAQGRRRARRRPPRGRRDRRAAGRAALLPAYVEIALAVGEVEGRGACKRRALLDLRLHGSDALGAISAYARGAVALARGEASGRSDRAARLAAGVAGARGAVRGGEVRVLVGPACAVLGDDDGAALELEAARSVFEGLGARPDLARLDSLVAPGASRTTTRTGSLPGSWRSFASSRPARRTSDRRLAGAQRADRRSPREQHLRQARRLLARSGDCLHVRVRSGLVHPFGRSDKLGGFSEAGAARAS